MTPCTGTWPTGVPCELPSLDGRCSLCRTATAREQRVRCQRPTLLGWPCRGWITAASDACPAHRPRRHLFLVR